MLTKHFRKIQLAFVISCAVLIGYQYFSDSDQASAYRLATLYASDSIVVDGPAKDLGKLRATLALQEYNKGVEETTEGCNCGPEIDKYTENSPAQWCTMFASWITMQAGSPMTDRVSGSWKIANSRVFEENLIANGTYFTKSTIESNAVKPKIGDYMIFSRGEENSGLGHIGIVVEYDEASNRIGMISGNFKDRIAYQRNYPYMEHSGFLGFGRPEK